MLVLSELLVTLIVDIYGVTAIKLVLFLSDPLQWFDVYLYVPS